MSQTIQLLNKSEQSILTRHTPGQILW